MARARLWFKASASIVLIAALGAGAAVVALKMFFPEPRARAYVLEAARKKLGREVRLAGIGAGLTGLRLQGLEISERPDFNAGTFVKVETFKVRPSWKALLRRKFVVASASAEGLSLRIIKNADGSFNYATLIPAAPAAKAAAPAPGPAAAPAEFSMHRLRVTRGEVSYRDAVSGGAWTVSDLSFTLDDFSLSKPFDLDAELRVQGRAGPASSPIDAAVAFEGSIHPGPDALKLEIDSLRVEREGLAIKGHGDVSASAPVANGARAVDADLKFKTPGIDTRLIAKWAPGLRVPSIAIPALDVEIAGHWDGVLAALKTLRATWSGGKLEGSGSVRALGSAKPIPDISLSFGVDLPAIKIGELPVAVSALPSSFVVPAMRLDGGARVRADDLYFEKTSFKGKSGTLRLDGSVLKALAGAPEPALEIQADLDLPALTDKNLPFPGVPPGLELPPSRWDADLSYTPGAIRLRKFGVKIASNEMSVEGGVTDPSGRGAFDLVLKCKRFVLAELTRLTPKTRDLKMTGEGFFALSITGTKEKPVFGGKLQFKDLGATIAELPLSGFTGTASFDERRVDVPNLKGMVADGALKMDLTIKDYTKVPEVQLEASLDRFDLGRYLTAKKKLEQDVKTAKAAKAAKSGKAVEDKSAAPFRTRGKIDIGALLHPNAQVQNVAVNWDLYGVTPDMKKLTGEAKLGVGGGTLHAVGDVAAASPMVKIMIFPILIIQKIGRIGGLRLLPDFNDITVRKIVGDYAFKDGLMTLRRSEMDSNAALVSAVGTIDLPAEVLDLLLTAQIRGAIADVAPIEVVVTGTLDKPKSSVKLAKFLATPAQQLLEGLLRR